MDFCGGRGSGDCPPTPAGPRDLSHAQAAISARRPRTGRPHGRELIKGQRLAADEDGEVLVWIGEHRLVPCPSSARTRTRTPGLHPTLSRGENSHLPQCARRRAQAGHGALWGFQGLDGTHPGPRSRSRPTAPRSRPPPHDGRGAPLRGHRQPGARRWHYGPVWCAHCP